MYKICIWKIHIKFINWELQNILNLFRFFSWTNWNTKHTKLHFCHLLISKIQYVKSVAIVNKSATSYNLNSFVDKTSDTFMRWWLGASLVLPQPQSLTHKGHHKTWNHSEQHNIMLRWDNWDVSSPVKGWQRLISMNYLCCLKLHFHFSSDSDING